MDSFRLHAGPDLVDAAAQSSVGLMHQTQARFHLPKALNALLVDALNTPRLALVPRSVLVTGTERVSQTTMRILFRGQLRAVDFCADHILGSTDFRRELVTSAVDPACDVRVVDHPLLDRGLFGSPASLTVPQWIQQRCLLQPAWQLTVENFPVSLRKRVSRLLGRHRFSVTIETGTAAKIKFYREIYLPYVQHRFGSTAILAGERSFLREAQDALLLGIHAEGRLLGASMVRIRDTTLSMGKSGLTLGTPVKHVFDLLDYFCFLLAQLAGCRILDLGVSRPHLEDGVFANKAKWRPELVAAGKWKPAMRITPVSHSPATLGFLSRNGFIEQRAEGFAVRTLHVSRIPDRVAMEALGELARRSGLASLSLGIWAASARSANQPDLAPFPHIEQLEGADPLQAFLARP